MVEDSLTGLPVPGVRVTLAVVDRKNYWGLKEATAFTSADGFYDCKVVNYSWGAGYIGSFTLRAWGKEGYRSERVDLTPVNEYTSVGHEARHDFRLRPIRRDGSRRGHGATGVEDRDNAVPLGDRQDVVRLTAELVGVNVGRNTADNHYEVTVCTTEFGVLERASTVGLGRSPKGSSKDGFLGTSKGVTKAFVTLSDVPVPAGGARARLEVCIRVQGRPAYMYHSDWFTIGDSGRGIGRQVHIYIGR